MHTHTGKHAVQIHIDIQIYMCLWCSLSGRHRAQISSLRSMAAQSSQPPNKRRKIAEVSMVIPLYVEENKAHEVSTTLLLQGKKDVDSAFEVAATTITEKLWRPRASFTYQSLHRDG